MVSDAVLRGMRVLTLPSVLFTTGLAGHVAGNGATPAGWVLAVLFVLTVVAVAPFMRAALSPARVVALLVGGQGVLHAFLERLRRQRRRRKVRRRLACRCRRRAALI